MHSNVHACLSLECTCTSDNSFCSNRASTSFSFADFEGLFDRACARLKAPMKRKKI